MPVLTNRGRTLASTQPTITPALFLALITALPVAAQTNGLDVRPAPPEVLKAFTLNGGTVQHLSLPRELDRAFRISLVLGGQERMLYLQPHKLRACSFQLLVDDGNKLTAMEPPPENTFRGTVLDLPGSVVAASIWEGQISAQIHVEGTTWAVEPLTAVLPGQPIWAHIVYRNMDMMAANVRCGVSGTAQATHGGSAPSVATNKACQIAIDCDLQYYQRNGSNATQTQNAVAQILNMVDAIYQRDVGICYQLKATIIRTTAVYTKGPATGCEPTGGGLLSEMQGIWNANHTNVVRDVALLLSGTGTFSSGYVGCAFLGVVCKLTNAYCVSRPVSTLQQQNVALVAHELGHTWGAQHCDASTLCYLMCSWIGGCSGADLKFELTSQQAITTYRDNSGTCLGNCGPCGDDASFSYFGTGCAGSAIGSGLGCVQQNWTTNLGSNLASGDWTAIEVNSGATAREFTALHFYCKAAVANASIPVAIFERSAAGTPGAALAQGTLLVGTAAADYKWDLPSKLAVNANTRFFVAYKDPNFSAGLTEPAMTSGTLISNQVWAVFQGVWGWRAGSAQYFNFRLDCTSARATPLLFYATAPRINQPLTVDLWQGPPNSLWALVYSRGVAQLDLTTYGAPSCWFYISNDFYTQQGSTNAAGRASLTFQIPNLSTLCGWAFYQQVLVADATANPLRITFTRRGQPVIGN